MQGTVTEWRVNALKTLSEHDITHLARDWAPLIEAAEVSLIALAAGTCQAPLRTSLDLPGGQLLTMTGRIDGSSPTVVKVVTVIPGNATRDLPTIQAVALLFDSETGRLVATLDGTTLTAVRTGAISAAAVRKLAPPDARRLTLLGAGAQAYWQARAIAAVLPLEGVHVWAPTHHHREQLAWRLARELDVEAHPIANLREAMQSADVICCATTARSPFLHAGELPGNPVLIVAIGAYRPDMAEVAPSVFKRAGGVYVDDRAAVMAEGGDVMAAVEEGAIAESDVVSIGNVLSGQMPRETSVTVFKSVGSAVEDAAVAAVLLDET